jgi:transglutaminase-like putative cysteine protease
MRLRIPICLSLLLFTCSAVTAAVEPRYYSLLLQGKKAGYTRIQEERQGAGLKVSSDCLIKVTMLGAPFDLRYQAIALYARPTDALPTRYTVSFDAGPRKITSDCRFSGRKAEIDYAVNGIKEHKSLTLPAGCYLIEGNLPETWERTFRAAGPVRKPKQIQIFSPTAAATTSMTLRPGKAGGVVAESGGTSLEFTLKKGSGAVASMNVPSQSAEFRLADKGALQGVKGVEAASRAFAVTDVALDNSQGLDSLTVDVKAGIAGEKITDATLQTPRQKFSGTVKDNTAVGRLTIKRVRYDGTDAAALPLGADLKKRHAAFLKPDSMIESDDPEIKALAAKLAAGSKTTWEATQKIGQWVHENIAYKITGVGAKQCLKEKSGDCGPHAWLSIALLRAAGIPAKITGGALYSDLLGGSFGQHYWTSVWVGEKPGWVPIDTTTGEIGVLSPAHLNLWSTAGGLASLSVKVVDYAPKKAAGASGAEAAQAPRLPLSLRPDERWSYTYTDSGKPIGKETARVVAVRPGGEREIRYDIELTVQDTKVTCGGIVVVKPDGTAQSLTMKVDQVGIVQTVDVTVEGRTAKAAIQAAGIKNQRSTELPAGATLALALSTMTWDLIFRTVPWEVGKQYSVAVYLVDGLRLERIKFKVAREETVKAGGESVACYVLSLNGKEQFWLEKGTGRIVRAVPGGDKMVVERSPTP